MIIPRLSHERGFAEHGWLKSRHSFSFADYYDPNFMGFSALRVINEDWIAPSMGFGMHPHKDMEILTYVLSGAVAHKDSMGNSETVPAGEFQLMSAGTGVRHSEFNPSDTDELHLYQIWIMPNRMGVTPRYEQARFDEYMGGTLILSPTGESGSFVVYQDTKLWRYQLDGEQSVSLDKGRAYWLQIAKGSVVINGEQYQAGDAAAMIDENQIIAQSDEFAEFLLFDLPRS
ncbi:Quercetin 2,3-dioxygenase [Moraxella lacunata]|uniref:Quercetin 2,3-dioxygenase n=1 Tax=Moraxella lacunata TaxID=477 RepID=A0A378T7W4_MORLA|nr:pirin family protein [Moraxella lacunata]STZ55963.1 Quercetin 2,3-dioxygenase [Moraxella lacunata]